MSPQTLSLSLLSLSTGKWQVGRHPFVSEYGGNRDDEREMNTRGEARSSFTNSNHSLSSQDCRAQRLSRLLSGAGRKLGDAFPPLPLPFSNLSLRGFYFAASLPPPRCLSLPRVSPSLSSNVELFERSDPLPARRSMLVNPRISNSSFALAAERTRRKDPLDSYNYYTGGWNISNIHYGAVR